MAQENVSSPGYIQEKARENQEVLELLYSMAQDMSFRRSPSFLLDQTLGRVAKVMRVEAASLFILNDETGLLDFSIVKGLNAQALRELDLHLKPDEGLAGWVFSQNKPAIVNDTSADPRFKPGVDWLTGFKTHNILAAPLRIGGKPFGVLEVVNRKKKAPFDEEDAALLSAIAHLLTTTLDNVRTLRALETSQVQLKTLLENLPGGFIGVDRNGRVTHANPRAAEILEWVKIPLNLPMNEALAPHKDLGQALAQVLAEEKPVRRQSFQTTSLRWGKRTIGYTAFPLGVEGKITQGAGVLFQDITGVDK